MNTEIFPVYDVLVNSVFGSIGLAIMGIAFIILVILLLTRSSTVFTINWMLFYFLTMGTLYFGALVLVLGMIFVTMFMAITLIRGFGGD